MDTDTQNVAQQLPKRRPLVPRVLPEILPLFDMLVIASIGMGTWIVYVARVPTDADTWPRYLFVSLVGAAFLVALIGQRRGYELRRLAANELRSRQIGQIGIYWILFTGGLISFLFFMKASEAFSRVWLACWFGVGLFYWVAGRYWLARRVRLWEQSGELAERCAVVGSPDFKRRVAHHLRNHSNLSYDFVATTNVGVAPGVEGPCAEAERVIELARNGDLDRVIVSDEDGFAGLPDRLRENLRMHPVTIQLCLRVSLCAAPSRSYDVHGHVPFFTLSNKPLTEGERLLKRAEDIVLASLVLLVFLPLMFLIALAVKLDSRGPIIFRQIRYGLGLNFISVYKFRTLFVDKGDQTASHLVTEEDPRVTRVGRFLRRTSLDELPQLINVLKGEMSLVGPRPHATYAKAGGRLYREVTNDYFMRYRIKPGLTGWAQIKGWRGETKREEDLLQRVNHDLEYIENWSLVLDLKIIVRTLGFVFQKSY